MWSRNGNPLWTLAFPVPSSVKRIWTSVSFVRRVRPADAPAAAPGRRRVAPSDPPRDQRREGADVGGEPRGVVHRGAPPVRDQRTEPQARGRLRFRKGADDDQVGTVGDAREEGV